MKWIQLINRLEADGTSLWEPRKQSRVCSRHFKDGAPTSSNPYPTECLGYTSSSRERNISKQRRSLVRTDPPAVLKKKKKSMLDNDMIDVSSESIIDDQTCTNDVDPIREVSCDQTALDCFFYYSHGVFTYITKLIQLLLIFSLYNQVKRIFENDIKKKDLTIKLLMQSNKKLTSTIKHLNTRIKSLEKKCVCQQPIDKVMLKSDKDVLFYTSIKSISIFDILFSYIKPLVRRKWRGPNCQTAIVRSFKKSPKKIGPKPKLSAREEFLMCLMKIKLGLLHEDLSRRFNVSKTLASRIFSTWVRATASVVKSFVYVPDMEKIISSRPTKFDNFSKLHSIADATEIFLQTPKNHVAQRVTWSNYKHHNTAKVLISITPNGFICFASDAYGGSISDKQITLDSGYLDCIDPHTEIMVDKGFNIVEECAARFINVLVPPGKRGQSQMLTSDVRKTQQIAKLRILVEQVIRRFKTFHLLARELPISLTSNIDDIVIICAALINLQKPIYK